MTNSQISDSLTLMFVNKGLKDNANLMRAHMLCMDIAFEEHTLESIKETPNYINFEQNVAIPDEFLEEILAKAKYLKES